MKLSDVVQILKTHQQEIRSLMIHAGEAVMEIYNNPTLIEVQSKRDTSPLTSADIASHKILCQGLASIHASWPVLSEESETPDAESRMAWTTFWLVDPLDGTQEFIHRSDEFTINAALILEGKPIAGWVCAPATAELYEAIGSTAPLTQNQKTALIRTRTLSTPPTLLSSRRHDTDLMDTTLADFQSIYGHCDLRARGSSLKICELAAGRADFYPRLGPTHEWDTAAAHAVLKAAGGDIFNLNNAPLTYNQTTQTLNPYFIAVADIQSPQRAHLIEKLKQHCADN